MTKNPSRGWVGPGLRREDAIMSGSFRDDLPLADDPTYTPSVHGAARHVSERCHAGFLRSVIALFQLSSRRGPGPIVGQYGSMTRNPSRGWVGPAFAGM